MFELVLFNHFSNEHFNQNQQTQIVDNNLTGIVLINGEHFFSIAQKVDYAYNMFLVGTELYKLIRGYKLHIDDIL